MNYKAEAHAAARGLLADLEMNVKHVRHLAEVLEHWPEGGDDIPEEVNRKLGEFEWGERLG